MRHVNINRECLCCKREDKQTILTRNVPSGETGSSLLTSHLIIFVISGSIRYTFSVSEGVTITVSAGEFVFVPSSVKMSWEAREESAVLRFRLSDVMGHFPECRTFRFQRNSADPEDRCVYPLKMNEGLRPLIEDILGTERDGLKCSNYAQCLVQILLTRIQVYYPQEECALFYSTAASTDVTFSEQVYEKWMGCRKVRDLADVMNMTVRQFVQNFRRVFGTPPGLWLYEHRKEYIYHDICSSSMPIGEIAVKHGFLLSNLVRYCRMNFGKTPGEIRDELDNSDTKPVICDDEQDYATPHVSSADPGIDRTAGQDTSPPAARRRKVPEMLF